jgi:hypothetical protein
MVRRRQRQRPQRAAAGRLAHHDGRLAFKLPTRRPWRARHEILGELGYSADKIAELRKAKVVA